MISRFAYTKEVAGMAPQVYFVCRTIGAFISMFLMTKMSEIRYLRLNIVACLAFALVLALVSHEMLDFICIGGIFVTKDHLQTFLSEQTKSRHKGIR